MLFLFGELLLVFGILYYCMILVAARNPNNKSWWIQSLMIESVHLFFILGPLVMGPILMIKAIPGLNTVKAIGFNAAGFLALFLITALAIKAMHIKERLTAYAKMGSNADVIDFASIPTKGKNENDHPSVQKAA